MDGQGLPEARSPAGSGCAGRRRVAGVVVLYHPGPEVAENIESYRGEVAPLVVVDNSEPGPSPLARRLAGMDGVILVAGGANLGVARALNIGAGAALDHGCDYLLTMDQDSRATPGMVAAMLDFLATTSPDDVGIVTPYHLTKPGMAPPTGKAIREVPAAMTSGNILSLEAYRVAGPFMDELFVDFVDIEYCLRLRARGFRIVRTNRAVLEHRVGKVLRFGLPGWDLYLTSHDPLRKYYKTRNRFFVTGRYRNIFPAYCWRDRIRFCLEFLRLILFEGDRRAKLNMTLRGLRDFRQGRLGRFDPGGGGDAP